MHLHRCSFKVYWCVHWLPKVVSHFHLKVYWHHWSASLQFEGDVYATLPFSDVYGRNHCPSKVCGLYHCSFEVYGIDLICHLVFALWRCFCFFAIVIFSLQKNTCRDLSTPSTFNGITNTEFWHLEIWTLRCVSLLGNTSALSSWKMTNSDWLHLPYHPLAGLHGCSQVHFEIRWRCTHQCWCLPRKCTKLTLNYCVEDLQIKSKIEWKSKREKSNYR